MDTNLAMTAEMSLTRLRARAVADPESARRQLRVLIHKHGGNLCHAARELAVSYRTLLRTLDHLGLYAEVLAAYPLRRGKVRSALRTPDISPVPRTPGVLGG